MRVNSYEKATQLFAKGATVAQVKKQLKIKDAKTPWLYRAKKKAAAATEQPPESQPKEAKAKLDNLLIEEMRRIAHITNQLAADMVRLKIMIDIERHAGMGK